MTIYTLGVKSKINLKGVHADLVRVVERAIFFSEQDFSVFEGLRTQERQKEYFRRGVTKTMNSKHLVQPSGYGHAVDLVPYIDGGVRWEWPLIYPVAIAMRQAALYEGVPIRWGGIWDRMLNDLPDNIEGLKKAVQEYCIRHPGPDFLDGPHYELPR